MAVELIQSARRGAKGFSFIELLVAMLILATAVFAHLRLHGQIFLEQQNAQRHLLAHWIGLEWLRYVESGLVAHEHKSLGAGPPPAISLSCLNRYCTSAQFAAYQAALVKCQVAEYYESSGCVIVRDRDALLPRQQTVRLPSGEVTATADGSRITMTWQHEPMRDMSLSLGGWR